MAAALLTVPKQFGLIVLPDEFGYMAQAAGMAGMDWKAVQARCSWYSFGYGILIFPFMKLLDDGIALYRCMTGLNFIFMGISTVLLFALLTRCFQHTERKLLALISGAAVFYVAYITYAQMAMTEILLTFLYMLLAWLAYRWFCEPSLKRGCFMILAVGYMYMVHMRTIGIFVVTLFLMAARLCLCGNRKRYWKQLILYIILFAALFLITGVIKNTLIQNIGSEAYSRKVTANDYSGQWGKLLRLFSLKGVRQFLMSFIGKLFYLGCASFGLYYWGIFFLLKKGKSWMVGMVRRESHPVGEWWYVWLLLSHISALFISVVYCSGDGRRLDTLLYGRYHENTILCILALGILELLQRPALKKRIIWMFALESAGFLAIYAALTGGNIVSVARQSITGILYALNFANYYDTKTLLYAYFFSMAGGLLILGLVWLTKGGNRWYGLLVGISFLQMVTAREASRSLTTPSDAKRENARFVEQVRDLAEQKGEDRIFYLYQDSPKLLYPVQYLLQDISLHLVSEEELEETDCTIFLIIPKGNEVWEDMPAGYDLIADSPSYELYYNPG